MENYIFIEGEGSSGVFLKQELITSIKIDKEGNTAVITTSELEVIKGASQQRSYTVQGFLAVRALHDHFYQLSPLKLWKDR